MKVGNYMITKNDIEKAYEIIKSNIIETPIVESIYLSNKLNSNIYLKLENLQRTGSFKIRGATNKIHYLTTEEKEKGLIASSAGNHAQGVALAAKLNNIKATIVMPENAPSLKINATKNYGAEVVLSGDNFDDAYSKAVEIQEKTGKVFLHAFNDEKVVAGQGTIGIEIIEKLPNIDTVIVPIGGGGLIAGIALYLKSINSNIKIIGIESIEAKSMKEAIEKKEIIKVDGKYTIADGIAVRKVGDITYEICKKYIDEIYTVDDLDITRAILKLAEHSKVISEGAGAVAVAALISNKIDKKYIENKNVCAVISGGNLDVNDFEKYINKAQILEGRRAELEIIITDKSGELNKFTDIIKRYGVNILYINQTRYEQSLLPIEQKLEIVLECRDKDQLNEVIKDLEKNNFRLTHKK